MAKCGKVTIDLVEFFLKVRHVFLFFICFIYGLIAPFFSCFLFIWITAKVKSFKLFLIRHYSFSFRILFCFFDCPNLFLNLALFLYYHLIFRFSQSSSQSGFFSLEASYAAIPVLVAASMLGYQ